jgi:2-(1,2-epoxy-1,2-dihydrophenyl)acetyl-CoA isomerase
MNLETIQFEVRESVAVIMFNRPAALNALSLQLTKDLLTALDAVGEQKARAAILTGAGRAFCAGGDLREMHAIASQTGNLAAFFETPLQLLHGAIQQIREMPVPFVAAVNGVCAGAGTNFALACDIVLAGESASFNEGFVKIGLSPDCGGSYFLPRLVGEKLAAELLMTGDAISAKRAAEIGLVNRVVADEALMDETFSFAKRLAQMPTASIAKVKKMLLASATNSLSGQLNLEHQLQIESGQTNDFKEGVAAFFEKRQPNFRGD